MLLHQSDTRIDRPSLHNAVVVVFRFVLHWFAHQVRHNSMLSRNWLWPHIVSRNTGVQPHVDCARAILMADYRQNGYYKHVARYVGTRAGLGEPADARNHAPCAAGACVVITTKCLPGKQPILHAHPTHTSIARSSHSRTL